MLLVPGRLKTNILLMELFFCDRLQIILPGGILQ